MLLEDRRVAIEAKLVDYRAQLESAPGGNESGQWLEGGRDLSRKDANKFLLCSYIAGQWHDSVAARKVKEFVEYELQDPEDLWTEILGLGIGPWRGSFFTRPMHRFPDRHDGIWTLAEKMVRDYESDARRIWQDQDALRTLDRLREDLAFGPQTSRMAVGGLFDEGLVDGSCDVKADVHVRRVVGRLCAAREFTDGEATVATRELHPHCPWTLDWPLWNIAKDYCKSASPKCSDCPTRTVCTYGGGQLPATA
jgi:hypothetical protein